MYLKVEKFYLKKTKVEQFKHFPNDEAVVEFYYNNASREDIFACLNAILKYNAKVKVIKADAKELEECKKRLLENFHRYCIKFEMQRGNSVSDEKVIFNYAFLQQSYSLLQLDYYDHLGPFLSKNNMRPVRFFVM